MPLSDQRIANLSKATSVRVERAEAKRQVRAGTLRVSHLLCQPDLPAYAVGWEIGKLLACIYRVSYKGACGLLAEQRIDPLRGLGKLTYRQRRVLASHVKDRWETPKPTSGRRAIRHHSTIGSSASRARIDVAAGAP